MKTIIITLLLIINICLYSQYKVEWSAEVSSTGNLSIDKARFVAVDGDGNVFVTGVTNGDGMNDDITTIKYDKDGKLVWQAVFNGTGNYHDRPNGMVIDGSGNIYITGSSKGDGGTADDFITIKYNPSGAKLWSAAYASKGGIGDESKSIAVDMLGNVYITGHAAHIVTDNSGMDWITIKYNTNGEQVWLAAYDDGITSDGATSLTIDEAGNVYVTGQCNAPAYHIAVINYDSSGVKRWIAKYDGSAVSSDKPVAVKVDKQGFVYITGHSSEANKDFITIKYDNNGNEMWKNNFNGQVNMADEAENLVVDNDGSVYVIGYSTVKKNNRNRCLIKYNSAGDEVWKILSDKSISKNIDDLSIAIDKDGNIYVTGSSAIIDNKKPTDMMVDCYTKDGALLWQAYFSKENSIPVASKLVVDNNSNVYVTGYIMGSKGFLDYCTVKFSK